MLTADEPHPGHARVIAFQEVDAQTYAADAAALLRRAWTPPCVRYSDAYVTWQLTFPALAPARAVLAMDGPRVVGFVALIPRRITCGAGTAVISVLSFFAVDAHYRGRHIGSSLASRILDIADRPVVTYTEPGSRSERVLAAAARARGWIHRQMATLRTYAGGPGCGSDMVAAREVSAGEFVAAVGQADAATTVWSQPNHEQATHYLGDPRGACFAVAHGRGGATLGAALIVRAQLLTASGAEDVPSLESVHLHAHHGEVLSAFRALAIDRSVGASLVTAPSLHTVPPDAIRHAGFRATRSAFNAAILGDPAEFIVRETRSTNLEVF
jgi:hypothetical protein